MSLFALGRYNEVLIELNDCTIYRTCHNEQATKLPEDLLVIGAEAYEKLNMIEEAIAEWILLKNSSRQERAEQEISRLTKLLPTLPKRAKKTPSSLATARKKECRITAKSNSASISPMKEPKCCSQFDERKVLIVDDKHVAFTGKKLLDSICYSFIFLGIKLFFC